MVEIVTESESEKGKGTQMEGSELPQSNKENGEESLYGEGNYVEDSGINSDCNNNNEQPRFPKLLARTRSKAEGIIKESGKKNKKKKRRSGDDDDVAKGEFKRSSDGDGDGDGVVAEGKGSVEYENMEEYVIKYGMERVKSEADKIKLEKRWNNLYLSRLELFINQTELILDQARSMYAAAIADDNNSSSHH